jgi:hypothetical protein
MIERLKFLIDQAENKPKIKQILLDVAKLSEDKQEDMLKVIEIILEAK